MSAIRFCSEKSYFLTSSLRPCIVELLEHIDDTDGVPERTFNKKHNDFNLARQLGPRIAYEGSFEHEYALRWKQLFDLYKQKQEALKQEMMIEADKLEAQMEYARFEHETEVLRQRLRLREGGNSRRNDYELKEQLQRQMQYNIAQQFGMREAELLQRQQQNAILMQVSCFGVVTVLQCIGDKSKFCLGRAGTTAIQYARCPEWTTDESWFW